MFVCFLINLVVRKVNQSRRIFFTRFPFCIFPIAPLSHGSVHNRETKPTDWWLKNKSSAGIGAMYVNNSESYNSAEPGGKVTAVPGPYGFNLLCGSHLRCSRATQHCSFFNTLENYHCLYLDVFTHIHKHMPRFLNTRAFLAWTHVLDSKCIWIHCQCLRVGDSLLFIHHVIHAVSSGGGTPLAPVQNPFYAEQLHAGWGVTHVPIRFCIARLPVFCLFKNLRISYLCTKDDGKNALGSNINSRELGQSNII